MTGGTLLDDVMPSWTFRERHTVWTPAGVDAAYTAVRAVTATEIRLFAPLMGIRMLPNRLLGRARRITDAPLLEQFVAHGFTVLGERPGREIVLGGVGRFWHPGDDGPVRGVRSREDFLAW